MTLEFLHVNSFISQNFINKSCTIPIFLLSDPKPRLGLVSTIQFAATLQSVASELEETHGFNVTVPQAWFFYTGCVRTQI